MVANILIVILIPVACFLFYKLMKFYKRNCTLKIYEDITLSVLNKDEKTRKQIEKLCNAYLEHKVINSKFANKKYLEQCQKILDDIKYINLINSIDEKDEKEKDKSQIEKAIEDNKKIEKIEKDKEIKKEGKK